VRRLLGAPLLLGKSKISDFRFGGKACG
jgi:hypothetical protein